MKLNCILYLYLSVGKTNIRKQPIRNTLEEINRSTITQHRTEKKVLHNKKLKKKDNYKTEQFKRVEP